MNRRTFLETAGKAGAGAALASLPLVGGCKGSPTTPDPPPPPLPPVAVTPEFTIYNHTKGPRGSFIKENVMSGSTLELSVADLIAQYGIGDVYDRFMAIWKTGLAAWQTRTVDGAGKLTVPRENTTYDIFLLNIDGQELYAANEALRYPMRLINWSREIDIYRLDFDGQTGEERVFGGEFLPELGENGIVDQVNKALSPEAIPFPYGFITRRPLPNSGSGSFAYGFGDCWGQDSAAAIPAPPPGYPIYWVGINPEIADTGAWQVGAGLGVLFEMLMSGSFRLAPGIYARTKDIIQENGILNQKGKDFIAYLYVRGQ